MFKRFGIYYSKMNTTRIISFIVASLYAIVYDYIIREYMVSVFGYMLKFQYHPMTISELRYYIITCATPILFYKGFRYLSSIISFFCYFFVYIPFVNTLFVADYPSHLSSPYLIFFFISQCVFFATDHFQIGKHNYGNRSLISFRWFEIICGIVMLLFLFLNYEKMHMVNVFDVDQKQILYELREENNSTSSSFNSYIMGWLNHVLLPILMVSYLRMKKYFKYLLAFIAMICVFMIDMQKISFYMPFVVTFFYFALLLLKGFFLKYFHVIFFVIFMITPLSLLRLIETPLGFNLASVLIMRTQCVEGRQFASYFDFFEITAHPFTYFTHIKIVNKLTGLYPYSHSIGYEVAKGEANSNATFFLMDGMAGAGLWGCFYVALFFMFFKAFFNTIGNNYDKGLCVIVLLFSFSSLMNSSLFTSLVTGGLLLFYVIFRTVNLYPLK